MLRIRLALALLAAPLVCAANAADTQREAVLAVIEKAFAAISSGDADAARTTQLADGTSISFRAHPDGEPGRLEMRMSTNEELLASDADDQHQYLERWTSDPIVMVRGAIAVAWGDYEFWIDGEFSHCGIDSVQLANVDGDWKIANWMWTVEKVDCPTDPSRDKSPNPDDWYQNQYAPLWMEKPWDSVAQVVAFYDATIFLHSGDEAATATPSRQWLASQIAGWQADGWLGSAVAEYQSDRLNPTTVTFKVKWRDWYADGHEEYSCGWYLADLANGGWAFTQYADVDCAAHGM